MPTILIVDDNENHRSLIEQELADEGYTVVAVKNGTEAMDYVSRTRPDLIITDVAMPRYNGIELIQDILKHDRTIPVIIYSGYTSYQNTFMAWAADAFVLKSGDVTDLKATINRVLEGRGEPWQAVAQKIGGTHEATIG